jgi:heterodisulfide reductase subunit A-like polyferredoxin
MLLARQASAPDIEIFKVKTGRQHHQADGNTLATSRKGVWAGGDAVTGPDSVIRAIAAGRTAASNIDKFLGGSGNIEETLTRERTIGKCAGQTPEDFAPRNRVKMPCLPVGQVKDNFTEVETGLYHDDAVAEGKRCFQCGFRSQITPPLCPPDVHKKRAWELENLKQKA